MYIISHANSCAANNGGVMFTMAGSSFNITSSTFTNNSAAYDGGVMYASSYSFNIVNSSFYANKANSSGGIMFIIEVSTHEWCIQYDNIMPTALRAF